MDVNTTKIAFKHSKEANPVFSLSSCSVIRIKACHYIKNRFSVYFFNIKKGRDLQSYEEDLKHEDQYHLDISL